MRQGTIEKWKSDLILEIARRKGFKRDDLDDAYQQLVLIVIEFDFDATHNSGASERTALTSLIVNQLNMIMRSEGRRRNHVQKIRRVCGPGQYEPLSSGEHMSYEREFELGIDVRTVVSRVSNLERAVCEALAQGTPRYALAKNLGISRYEVDRIVDGLREQFANAGLDI